jgi:putative ABC transport system substrate-binding protein
MVTLLAALALYGVGTPLLVNAQAPGKLPKVGLLFLGTSEADASRRAVFREGLRELQWIEGQSILFESRVAPGYLDRKYSFDELAPLAAELVQQKVDVIVAFGTLPSQVARGATATIPIVMAAAENPVRVGLVASLARPGGNVTGLTLDVLNQDLNAKRLELLKASFPAVSRVAVSYTLLVSYHQDELVRMEAAAPALGIEIRRVGLLGVEDLDRIFAKLRRDRIGAIRIQSDPVTDQWCGRIVELAIKHRLPTMFDARIYVEAGGLMSYGPSLADIHRRAATYVDKILKGAKPADLPVEQPTKFALVINLKTAKALGLTIPQSMLIRANEVIR